MRAWRLPTIVLACIAAPGAMAQEQAPADILVTGSAYRGEVANAGARIDVVTKDLPLSIDVLTSALIADRQVRNLGELADNVAGVRNRQGGSGAFAIDFTIRGLQGGGGPGVAVNGFRVENFAAGFDPQAVERIEFLKGPASVLYGASGVLSGLVNIVTKVPQHADFLVGEAIGGAPAYGRATLDANLRLTDRLDSRTNLAMTHEDVANAFRAIDERFALQSLRWHGGNVSVLAEGSYFRATQPSREATQYPQLALLLALPKDFRIGEPWDADRNTGYTGRLDADWAVTPQLTLREGVHYQHYRDIGTATAPYSADLSTSLLGPNLVARSLRENDTTVRYVVSQTEARWSVAIGRTRHILLAGFEYGHESYGGPCCARTDIAPLDLTAPVYGAARPATADNAYYAQLLDTKAVYVQDFVVWRRFRLLAGLRRDDPTSSSAFCNTTTPGCPADPVVANRATIRKRALLPRAGLAWQPGDRTTLFVSWSRSFSPNPALDRNDHVLPPELGTQYEAGLRYELLGAGRLTLSGALFRLDRRNIAECDPAFPDCSRAIAIGAQRVAGGELELAGKPVAWLDLIATYTHLAGRVTRSDYANDGIAVGDRLPEAAPDSASLFANAELAPLGLSRLALSAGVYYVAARPVRALFSGDFASSPYSASLTTLPAGTRLDLGGYWQATRTLRVQANITNLLDARLYEPTNEGVSRTPPRRATLGVRVAI